MVKGAHTVCVDTSQEVLFQTELLDYEASSNPERQNGPLCDVAE